MTRSASRPIPALKTSAPLPPPTHPVVKESLYDVLVHLFGLVHLSHFGFDDLLGELPRGLAEELLLLCEGVEGRQDGAPWLGMGGVESL